MAWWSQAVSNGLMLIDGDISIRDATDDRYSAILSMILDGDVLAFLE